MEIFTTSEIILGLCNSDSNTVRAVCSRNVVVWMYLSEHTQLPHYQEISIIMGDEIFACFQSIFNMFHGKITLTSSQDLKIIYETYLGSSSVSDDWSFWCPEDVFIDWNLVGSELQKVCFYLYGTFLDKPRSGDTGGRSNIPLHSLYEDCSILSVSIKVS